MATSLTGTNITDEDELDHEAHRQRTSSARSAIDDDARRPSDSSSITNFTINKTSSQFHLNSKASSRASGMNLPPTLLKQKKKTVSETFFKKCLKHHQQRKKLQELPDHQ